VISVDAECKNHKQQLGLVRELEREFPREK
jgi:hypothetical protein